jgi:signal transduction histidine kinase
MNNSLRHGKATKIAILFEEIENRKQCTYTDNGIGFVIDSSDNMKGLGMKNIESRIAFLKGAMDVKSAPNEGVTIIFNFD